MSESFAHLRRPRAGENDFARPAFSSFYHQPPPSMRLPGSAEKVSSEIMAFYNIYRHAERREEEELDDESLQKQLPGADYNNKSSNAAKFRGMSDILVTEEVRLEIEARLDTVQPETVGRIRWKELRDATKQIQWMGDTFDVLDDPTKMKIASQNEKLERIAKRGVPNKTTMYNEMIHVLDQLTKVGMYERIHYDTQKAKDILEKRKCFAAALMFMVEKIGKTVTFNIGGIEWVKNMLRVITDARLANVSLMNHLPYHIFTLEALFQCLSNVFHRSKNNRFFCINADLRHWFFQILLPEHWREMFRFEFGECYFRPRVLPMGWYLSPPIAQTCTWGIILSGNPPFVDKQWLNQLKEMPPWVPLRNIKEENGKIIINEEKGGIFVIQDNILVITEDEDVAVAWKKHLKERAEFFNAEFKAGQGLDVVVLSRENPDVRTEFNGISIGFTGWKTAHRKDRDSVESLEPKSLTHRAIHSLLGEVLWDLRVRQEAALEHESFMRLFRVNTPATKQQWGHINVNFTQEYVDILKYEVINARKHQEAGMWPYWSAVTLEDAEKEFYAVDASLEGRLDNNTVARARLAICHLRNAKSKNCWFWQSTRKDHVYIGEAELEAIIWAVEDAIRKNPKVRLITIVTDSLCAKGWIERMYSDRLFANDLLSYLRQLLLFDEDGNVRTIKLTCMYIMSEHNLADVPTRDDESRSQGWFIMKELERDDRLRDVLNRMRSTNVVVSAVMQLLVDQLMYSGARVIRQQRLETERREK